MSRDSAKVPINLRDYGMHPLSLRIWHGMALDAWLRTMRGKWHLVSASRYPLVVMITLFSIGNIVVKGLSALIYGRRLTQINITPDPIFVIGHWRSGTTWLHQTLMADRRYAAPDALACFSPETFLVLRHFLKPFLRWALPETRVMDNVKLTITTAEEDEFGICLSGALSPLRSSMFPLDTTQIPTGPDEMTPQDATFWRNKWLTFLRRVQYVNPGKQLVLKSPGHTLRTDEILRQFPSARFIHILRDPYALFLSNRENAVAMRSACALQDHLLSQDQRDAVLISNFTTFHRKFEAAKGNIPKGQLATIRYEDLRADTVGVLRQVYADLGLGGFEDVAPAFSQMTQGKRAYKTNQYTLDDTTRNLVENGFAAYFERYGYKPMTPRPASAP